MEVAILSCSDFQSLATWPHLLQGDWEMQACVWSALIAFYQDKCWASVTKVEEYIFILYFKILCFLPCTAVSRNQTRKSESSSFRLFSRKATIVWYYSGVFGRSNYCKPLLNYSFPPFTTFSECIHSKECILWIH